MSSNSAAKILVGSATRYIAGRNAMQTIYWRESAQEQPQAKMIKVAKTLHFKGQKNDVPRSIQNQSQNGNVKFL